MDDQSVATRRPRLLAEFRGEFGHSASAARTEARSREATKPANAPIAALLVADEERLLWRTVMGLSGRGFDVRATARVEDAPLRIGADWAPDAIVLDLRLPPSGTASVARALRSTYAVPVIVA